MEEIKEEIKEEVKEKTNIEDDVYRLDEMADEMLKSLNNLKKVREEHLYLIEVLSKMNDEKLKGLIEELKNQVKNFERQIEILTTRQIILKDVCASCDSIENRILVNNVLTGIGMFSQEN